MATVVAAAIIDNAIRSATCVNLLIAMTPHAFQENFRQINIHEIGHHRWYALIHGRRLTLDAVTLPLVQGAGVRARIRWRLQRAVRSRANPDSNKDRGQHDSVFHLHLECLNPRASVDDKLPHQPYSKDLSHESALGSLLHTN